MEDQSELRMESLGGVRPIEVIPGPTGRRRWPDALKARIVAETLQPGVLVCEVAARYGIAPHHLSGWRTLVRQGALALSATDMPAFVPVAFQLDDASAAAAELRISFGDMTLHVPATFPAAQAAAFVAALRTAL